MCLKILIKCLVLYKQTVFKKNRCTYNKLQTYDKFLDYSRSYIIFKVLKNISYIIVFDFSLIDLVINFCKLGGLNGRKYYSSLHQLKQLSISYM